MKNGERAMKEWYACHRQFTTLNILPNPWYLNDLFDCTASYCGCGGAVRNKKKLTGIEEDHFHTDHKGLTLLLPRSDC